MSTYEEQFPSEALDTSTNTEPSQVAESSQSSQVAESSQPTKGESFEDKVTSIVSQMVQGDDGIWKLPENVEADEAVLYAARAEKRRRDTESKLGKTTHALKALEAEKAELQSKLQQYMADNLTSSQRANLEELKYSDPDKWREEINKLERAATAKAQEELGTISAAASQQAELERRAQVLIAHNEANKDFAITDATLADLPPRIVRRLEKGETTFEEFLAEASNYLRAGKVIGSPAIAEPQPNLGNAGGGAKPADYAVQADLVTSYENEIY
jgi:hypothetical protein